MRRPQAVPEPPGAGRALTGHPPPQILGVPPHPRPTQGGAPQAPYLLRVPAAAAAPCPKGCSPAMPATGPRAGTPSPCPPVLLPPYRSMEGAELELQPDTRKRGGGGASSSLPDPGKLLRARAGRGDPAARGRGPHPARLAWLGSAPTLPPSLLLSAAPALSPPPPPHTPLFTPSAPTARAKGGPRDERGERGRRRAARRPIPQASLPVVASRGGKESPQKWTPSLRPDSFAPTQNTHPCVS